MKDPRSNSPGSIMPPYPWLFDNEVDVPGVTGHLRALRTAGTPYTDADIQTAEATYAEQADEIVSRLAEDGFTAGPNDEIIAMIAYLQRLGVDGKEAIEELERAAGEDR